MPEPPESDLDSDLVAHDVMGLTDLGSDQPFEMPVGLNVGAAPVLADELVADLTAKPAVIFKPRKWYQGLGWGFWVAVGWVILWILLAIFASVLPLDSPTQPSLTCTPGGGVSSSHLLGCNQIDIDVFSQVIFGSRVSLVVGFASIALSGIVGGTLGIIAGYFRGAIDNVLAIISNVFLSFPSLVLGLVIVAYLGHTELDIVLIIAIVAWPLLFRVVRAATIEYSQREYVLAAQALGSKRSRILFTIILPDVVPSGITYSLVGVALAIVGEGALSYLGQSVPLPTPTWGNMIAAGSETITQNVTLALLSPAIAMFLFILAINFIGDRLRTVLDVREGVL